MPGVKFVSMREFNKKATQIMTEDVEKNGKQVVITKRGKPVSVLQKANETQRGKTETISNLKNKTNEVIAEVEKTGKRLLITRDEVVIASLNKITNGAFSIDE